MSAQLPNQSGLGIRTGDVVRTSYGIGPFEVWKIYGPYLWEDSTDCLAIYSQPHIGLQLIRPGQPFPGRDQCSWIGHIQRIGGRWFTAHDELFVEHVNPNGQLDLFGPTEEGPLEYEWQEGVNYAVSLGGVWRCWACGRDFNDVQTDRWCGPRCPDSACYGVGKAIVVLPEMISTTPDPRDIWGRHFGVGIVWNNYAAPESLVAS